MDEEQIYCMGDKGIGELNNLLKKIEEGYQLDRQQLLILTILSQFIKKELPEEYLKIKYYLEHQALEIGI